MSEPLPSNDQRRRRLANAVLHWLAPVAVGVALLLAWEWIVRAYDIPKFMLPAPSVIWAKFVAEVATLGQAWWVTVQTMLLALAAAVVMGVAAAALFASSRIVAARLFPYAIILQVTPLVAVAPIIVLWMGWERLWLTQALCAWIVAFFPILSNTVIGLESADRGLRDLFQLYGASRWQRLRWLLAPSALPYFLAGLRISANLALVGAIVAEFVIGPQADRQGLATVILVSQLNQDAPMMFAALALVSLTGFGTYLGVHGLSFWLLRGWHESGRRE
jgi:NitT/TauT family transport system permease protein